MSSSNLFGSSLKWKLLRSRLSISAPRMAIRTQASWPVQALLIVLIMVLGTMFAIRVYELGRSFTGINPGVARERIASLQEELERLRSERDQFSTTVNSAESQLNIERAAQKQLVSQVKALEVENNKLKEDLAFFESLLPADTGPNGISVRSLTADIIGPNQLRYRLLVMQGAKGNRDFSGNLQLMVTVLQNGNNAMIVFPDGKTGDTDKFKLAFRHYQRIEGVLTLPEGVTMKAVHARILEKGQLRAQHIANL